MFDFQKHEIVSLAKENGFRSETLEKVLRLVDVLRFINKNDRLSPYLVLKGGTAINLTVFNLPRLSVDIDLDFSKLCSRDEMAVIRKEVSKIIRRYMEINNYGLSGESKLRYALDSFVFSYQNLFGNKDNLKIEINYMNRVHIYEETLRNIKIPFLETPKVLTLNIYEMYGTKIKALLERCTLRDIYDVYHMINSNLFNGAEIMMIKKCVIFYLAIGNTTERSFDSVMTDFETKLNAYALDRIPQYLSSTLKRDECFSLIDAVRDVKNFISNLMRLNEGEQEFINEFEKGHYYPEMLFGDKSIVTRVKQHPMALWKTVNK